MGRPQGTCKVLVSRIHTSIDKKSIHSLLSKFGNIIAYEVRPNQDKDRSGYYRLLATYELAEQAHQAVRELTNYWFEGSNLRVEYYYPNHGDMNGGPNPHHKRHNGHMGGRGNAGMPNGSHAGGHGGHHGGRGGGPMMNGHMNGSLRSPMGGPGYYSGNVGHPPPKELPVRMLVPSDMVGAIIGKSGATITSITQQSQARIEVNKKNAGGIYAEGQMDKVINIYGANEACSQACKRILEVMLQESQQSNANTTNGAGASRRRDEPISLRLLAHNNLVGRVIGRSGIVIKKIMEETNAKINVSQMLDPRERVIVISGNLEEMSKAQQQITSKMRQCYEQDLQQAMMGGYGGPDMGPPPPQQIPPALSYAFHRPPLPPPPPHSYHGGPNGHHGGPHHHPGNFGPPGPYGHLGMSSPSGNFYPMGDGSVEVVHVWVPSCTVGAIIGTGGSSIREMIRASGCSIKVSQTNAKDEIKPKVDESAQPKQNESENSAETPSSSSAGTEGSHSTKRDGGPVTSHPNPSDRRVTVTGTGEAQWKAQCLLYRKVFMEAVQHLDLNPDVANDPQIRQGHLRVEINVPSNQVGRIIGKGGSTVKDMQRQSRAIIKLPEETSKRAGSPDEAVETPLYIIGDFHAVQAAQRRIRALIARNSQGGPTVANGSHAKKQPDETATQKVEGDCDQSESQC